MKQVGVSSSRIRWAATFAVLLFVSCTAPSFADSPADPLSPAEQELEGKPPHVFPASEEFVETTQIEAEGPQAVVSPELTDPSAAEGVPHQGLERNEALELLEGVFGLELEGPAGPFDELQVEKFLSDNVAVIAPGDQPEASPSSDQPTLIESTVPLRTETDAGVEATLDLGLHLSEGELQPRNPLVDVGIPGELGEGIDLSESGVKIRLANAPADTAPTTAATSVAFYPNVAENTDLAVAPTLTGVETLTQIRSSSSPDSQTFELSLPAGAELHATKSGGAEVTREDEALVGVAPPTAIDSRGTEVPVDLTVEGNSLTLTITPDNSTSFPVLLDPLFQTYEWYAKKTRAGINIWQAGEEEWSKEYVQHNGGYWYLCNNVCSLGQDPPLSYELPGLYVQKGELNTSGDHASWIYTVPRYFTDQAKYGERPHSYINHMTLSNLHFKGSSASKSPYLTAGLWDPNNGWVSLLQHEGGTGHGLTDMSFPYQFENPNANVNVKLASAGLWSLESGTSGAQHLYIGAATVELAEPASEIPKFAPSSGPSNWVNATAAPLNFSAEEAGLGIYAITVSDEQTPAHSWKTAYGCVGVGGSPCPRAWASTEPGHALKYEPAALPQGTNTLKLVAEDPLGHVSTPSKLQVKVDHTAPEVALSGTLTEQAKLGPKRPSYTLKVNATDGTEASPQSGVAKTVIEIDGKVVDQSSPGCSTKNCTIAREWLLEASLYSVGQHTVKVTATDAVGLSSSKTLTIELQPALPPTVALSGPITEQVAIGTSRPRYRLNVNASAEAGVEGAPVNTPTYTSSFGTSGSGNGQFSHPAGIAVAPNGNLWVVDENHYRVEKFNEAGEYLSSFGSQGTENGKFGRPTDVAVDAKGNIWVTDAGNSRIEEFNEKGEFITKVGSAGSGNLQFNNPESLAIDSKGNIWVGDTYNHRVQELNEKGEFVRVFGTNGSGQGQIIESTGIAVGRGGNVWVADWGNNRVSVFSETGVFIRQFGTEGAGTGQFKHPDVIEIDTRGNVWVGDQSNNRVQEFNQSGEYVTQFGTAGSGNGQFSFGWPMGIATDSKGHIWVSDTGNNRVQRWQIPNYAPTYVSSFGTYGAGNGQFFHPAGSAVDAKGNLWVVDENHYRVEKFNEAGEYLSAFGSQGTGNGQFTRPTDVAIDAKGNLWVTDAGNSRIEEFNEKGEFITKVGSVGSGNGQFNGAESLAIDTKGNIWVGDTYNGRLQQFNEKGEFVKVISSKGSGQGQLGEPTGIAVGPENTIWVADWQNNRVAEFSGTGTFLQQFGTEGTGNGQFARPDVIDVDFKGNVWVGDQNNGRIQEFNQSGEYITQFGTKGSGQGQFTFNYPMGIASDTKGHIWISDVANNRVQMWNLPNSQSEIATEITVDGKQVSRTESACASEKCSMAPEWTLESPSYSVGKHTVAVKATDGLGRSTIKSLNIEIQRDTTKPSLQSSGALVEAPEGWVEQESYGLNAIATDTGYGATSLSFKIDGNQVAGAAKTCPDGGCETSLSKVINMSNYSGGAHSAELIASDSAGNSSTKQWTINVDPDGHISIEEVEATLEAADETSQSDVITSNDELISEEEQEDGNDPTLIQNASGLQSEGAPDLTMIASDAGDGFKIQTPGFGIQVEPGTVGTGSTPMSPSKESVAVAGNTVSNVDTLIRPKFNGLTTFQEIRDVAAPETYSWIVDLPGGETMKSIDPKDIEVDFEDGTPAMLIAAESAHDALGKEVPTSLDLSEGNVITLTVEHREAAYTYPVVSGTGWEGGFITQTVARPQDEQEIKEEEERIKREEQEAREREWAEAEEGVGSGDESPGNGLEGVWNTSQYRPNRRYVYTGSPEMVDWVHRKRRSKAEASYCAWLSCSYWHTWEVGTWFWNGTPHQVGGFAWRGNTVAKCYADTDHPLFGDHLIKIDWSGPNPAPYGHGAHLNLWCNFHINWFNVDDLEDNYYQISDHLYGDGYQGQHIKQYEPLVQEIEPPAF